MMPCFHWPSTSIHENMWNSKSCPEGDPYQKNGVMARKETAPSARTRTIAILDEGEGIQDQRCASEKFKRLSRIRRTTILVHLRISRRINSGEILWEKCCVKLAQSRWNRPPGSGSHQRRGEPSPRLFFGIREDAWPDATG